jgi:predicted ester cyclase
VSNSDTTGRRRRSVLAFGVENGRVTGEQTKLVVRHYLEEVVNTGDVDRIAEFISPEYVEVYRGARYPVGIDGARRHVLGVRQTYPDLHLTIDRQVAEGDWVVTQVTARGTHRGSWLGMKPTGRGVEFTAVNVDRVVGGRIVEHGGAANLLEPLLDNGAVRVVGPETERDVESGRCG